MKTIIFDPVFPWPIVVIGGIILVALSCYAGARLSRGMPRFKRIILSFLRALAICLLLAIFLQPSRLMPRPPQVVDKTAWIGIDTSLSMRQADVGGISRLDAAVEILREAKLLPSQGDASLPALRYFAFDEEFHWVTEPEKLVADGADTRFHDVLMEALNGSKHGSRARAIFLLTDGHDFQLVSPAQTGFAARARRIPIYAVPLGAGGNVRDTAVRISGYPPFCHIKQKSRIQAGIRLMGCAFEELECQLLRAGRVVQRRRVDTDQALQVFVNFDVVEEAPGQYEYEVRVLPLNNESTIHNNSAITYLTVVDEKIQVLLLEADPYWDTTFLQRSLRANEKFNIVSFVKYSDTRVRSVASDEHSKAGEIPSTAEGFNKYDVVILGRRIDSLLDKQGLEALEDYVRRLKGTVIFSRGPALTDAAAPLGIDPVLWGAPLESGGPIQVSRAGRTVAAFSLLATTRDVPDIIDAFAVLEKKSLATSLAGPQNAGTGEPLAGFIHRRTGQGQVLSVGVTGLWRWALNRNAEGGVTLFDRFWDQLILWLLSSRDMPSQDSFALRINSANILIGNKIYFRVICRDADAPAGHVSVSIHSGDQLLENITLVSEGPGSPQTGAWLPAKPGKYSVYATFPDNTHNRLQFVVYQENYEQTDVAVNNLLLRRLCSSSEGRVLAPAELGDRIRADGDDERGIETRRALISLWDRKWFFYLVGFVFGIEWFLRRRWGLC